MGEAVIIETGGTLSMGFGEKGELIPFFDVRYFAIAMKIIEKDSEEKQRVLFKELVASKKLIAEYGVDSEEVKEFLNSIACNVLGEGNVDIVDVVDSVGINKNVVRPYRIDSIDFSYQQHYLELRNSIMMQLERGNDAIVVGGTDTLEFYAQTFANDPVYQKFRNDHPESENNVVFVSSMKSFEEGAGHVAKILKGAVAAVKGIKPAGVFALSASDQDVSEIIVHDLKQKFTKISSVLSNAFRSVCHAGKVVKGVFERNPGYQAKDSDLDGEEIGKQNVAPPLIYGNSSRAILRYMQEFPDHAVIIEGGFPSKITNSADKNDIINLVLERSRRGIPTYFVNDNKYNEELGSFEPIVPAEEFCNSKSLEEIKKAGGIVKENSTTVKVYIDALFGKDEPKVPKGFEGKKENEITDRVRAADGQVVKDIGIRYIPDEEAFECALGAIKKITNKLIVRALPGEAIPARHATRFEELTRKDQVKVSVGFKYAGCKRIESGKEFVEGSGATHYGAALKVASFVESLGVVSPSASMVR